MSKPLREQVFDVMLKYGIEHFAVDRGSIDYVGSGGFIHAYSKDTSSKTFVAVGEAISSILNPDGSEPGDDDYILVLVNDFKFEAGTVFERGVDY